jgi:hypothetical protein
LEKKHAGCPNRCRAAKPWQDHFSNQGLNLKQEEGTQKNGEAILKSQL